MTSAIKIYSFLIMLLAFSASQAQTSKIISGSTNFSVKFVLGTCDGTFDAPKGTAVFDEKNISTASFNITVSAASFKTGNNSRDKDMKSEKYFFVSKYPDIHFKSSKTEKDGANYKTTGTLTIRDVSKTVTLPFEAKKKADGTYALSSVFEINRLDYKIGEKDWKLKDIVKVDLKAIIK
ncbi:YceI family protein [Dyadobacter psychrotolerans]|uniref:YceI family protein n=1 Tax=Dyadobacter psychrotolerans TaxID=2541721 RepID=A0A4R5DQY0_9BACT|nr:YceI family protein [Dyadobacter psychrotolerans]TDE16802.1 YceI family protein [Dyadobacter psychrotolerans]